MHSNKIVKEIVRRILKEELAYIKEAEPEETQQPDTAEDDKQDSDKEGGETKATAWERIKYLAGKLGTYKVNGKVWGFGKAKEKKAAEEKMKAIIEKESNIFIKDLDDNIKKTNKEFPNNVKSADFLSSVMSIAACYDSIIDATKKGNLPVDSANGIINDLREYVKNILDVKLSGSYATVDEDVDNEEEVSKEELKQIDEAFGLLEDKESDVRDKLNADRAARSGKNDKGDFQSTKMDTLKSNRLPLLLAGAAVSMGAYSWIANTEWFKRLFDIKFNYKDTETVRKLVTQNVDSFTDIKKGEGVYKLLSRTTGINLDGNQSPNSLVNALKQLGGGDADKGIAKLCAKGGVMMRPEDASKGLQELVDNPSKYKNLGQFFTGQASGTGKIVPTDTTLYGTIEGRALAAILTKQIPILVTNVVIKSGVKTGAAYATAKGLGSVLVPLAITAVVAGVVVKLMRVKGQKSSRAATLNALYQSMRNLQGSTIVEPEGEVDSSVEVPKPPTVQSAPVKPEELQRMGIDTGDQATDTGKPKDKNKPKNKQQGADKPKGENDDLYNTLKRTFQFIVNSRDSLGTRRADNVGRGPVGKDKKGKPAPERTTAGGDEEFKPGTPVDWKGGKGVIVGKDEKKFDKDGNNKIKIKRSDDVTVSVTIANIRKLQAAAKKSSAAALQEAYITDNELVNYLVKNLSVDKLKSFETLIKRIEILRNKIKKVKQGEDKQLNRLVDKFKSNPIMATDFESIFSIPPGGGEKEMRRMKFYIEDLFSDLYSGKFGRMNLIDKLGSVGGGNVNAILEKYYGVDDPNKSFTKDAQSKGRFKNNLIVFLQDAVRLFQHLHQKRR
jgi:hypothetical protein